MEKTHNSQLFIPLAIVATGVIIAGAIIFTNREAGNQVAGTAETNKRSVGEIRPVTAADHILGNLNTAEVFIVEFSDLECPFCKRFHETLKQVMAEYGESGKVAWVYRHFPLTNLHPKAAKEAEATECAAELGGELKFWEYIDELFEITPSNNRLDLALLPQIAEDVGLDRSAFEECLESGRRKSDVDEDLEDALNSGGRGTPHTILITKDGKNSLRIQGAQPFEEVKAQIEQFLNN